LRSLEMLFEKGLWQARLVTVLAVAASALLAVGMVYVSSVDAVRAFGSIGSYAGAGGHDAARFEILVQIIEVLDGYLLAAVMLILALGLYELFVSRIDAAENSGFAARLLLIRSLDDLKDRLAKVIVLMLVAKFFQQALRLKYDEPLDLLWLALGTLLIGGALWLTHRSNGTRGAEAA